MLALVKARKMKADEARELALESLDGRHGHVRRRAAGPLSGGQQQRVAIARSLAMSPS